MKLLPPSGVPGAINLGKFPLATLVELLNRSTADLTKLVIHPSPPPGPQYLEEKKEKLGLQPNLEEERERKGLGSSLPLVEP